MLALLAGRHVGHRLLMSTLVGDEVLIAAGALVTEGVEYRPDACRGSAREPSDPSVSFAASVSFAVRRTASYRRGSFTANTEQFASSRID